MRVMRVDEDGDGEATYELTGMSAAQAEMLGTLADFPLWDAQPARVAAFCEALHGAVLDAIPWGETFQPVADAHAMTPDTTVEMN